MDELWFVFFIFLFPVYEESHLSLNRLRFEIGFLAAHIIMYLNRIEVARRAVDLRSHDRILQAKPSNCNLRVLRDRTGIPQQI